MGPYDKRIFYEISDLGKRFLATMSRYRKIFAVFLLICFSTYACPCLGKTDFKAEVLPILEKKCIDCHRAPYEKDGKVIKPKAELRLDAAWAILKGGESQRPAVTAGNALHSPLYEVLVLPKDADLFMPKKGEPLTSEEIGIIKAWISEGADFGSWEGNLEGKPAGSAAAVGAPHERDHDLLYQQLSEGVTLPSEEVLQKLADGTGAQISPLAVGSPLLRVDFLTGVERCSDSSIESLLVIKGNIAHLDLARTKITDASMTYLQQMPRLTRLDLRMTQVTDTGIANLVNCKNLVFLNLFGTPVTDASITHLVNLKTLRALYISNTQITAEGLTKLHEGLPDADVVGALDMTVAPKGKGRGGKQNKNKKKNQ